MAVKLDWNAEEFVKWRQMADPVADDVVKNIIESDGTEGINNLFKSLRENDDVREVDFPDVVKEYFESTSVLPDWIDLEKVTIGQKVYVAYGPQISMCLLCKSLPEAYACAKGAKVLYATGRLTEKNGKLEVFTRRLMETSQFVVNVCVPGGLEDKGNGVISAQKVRLIHAAIRYYIQRQPWPEENGEPINQQDMAGTLQSFSTLTLEGLEKLNVKLTEEEKEGYYHCWRVVGHIIGLHIELNPPTYLEGRALGRAILKDQIAPSPEGIVLTQAVCDFMAGILPGNMFDHSPNAIIRFMVGDEIADQLGVDAERGLMDKIIPRLIGLAFEAISEVENSSAFYSKIISFMNLHLMQSMLHHFNDDKKVRFDIPPNLREDWKLD